MQAYKPRDRAAVLFLLLTRRVRPEKVYIEIDWPLLVMFIGLFIVVGGLEKAAITPDVSAAIGHQHLDNTAILAAVTAVLSNVVSNVPAVLLLKSFVPNLQDPQRAWLVIAMAATLAGNFTLVGSVANLIVAQRAKARGVEFNFLSLFQGGRATHVPDHCFWAFVALRQLGRIQDPGDSKYENDLGTAQHTVQ